MSLATYSKELSIYNAEDEYSSPVSISISTKNPTHGRITWSGDGKWLSVAPYDEGNGPLPIFKFSDNELKPMKYILLPNVTSASFFNWTNRILAVGNKSGEIFVWDVIDKKISVKVEYVESQPVDFVSVNSDDTYLATGSLSSNKICIHSLKTNKVVNKICLPKSKQTSSVKFCLCKKNYLGASSIDSTVCVWDITASDFIFKNCHAHTGACMDISFSPINYDVIASVSLTKTLKIYDIREKKSILDVNLEEPLNCVDIILNGDKVALGTTGGSVIIYDLRADKVLQTIKAHNGPVLSVKIQNLKIAKSYREVEMNTPDIIENPSKTLDISVMDVFSPISRNFDKDLSVNFNNHTTSLVRPQSTPNFVITKVNSSTPYEDSFFKKVLSPLPIQKSAFLGSTSQSSPNLYPIDEKTNSSNQSNLKLSDISIKKEILGVNGIGEGDGFNTDNSKERNLYYSDVISEIQNCKEAVLSEINSLKKEVIDIKCNFDDRFKTLENNYENLKKIITEDIQQSILTGNCNTKIEHSCQRILLNELNESFINAEAKIREEIKQNALRLKHIYDQVK